MAEAGCLLVECRVQAPRNASCSPNPAEQTSGRKPLKRHPPTVSGAVESQPHDPEAGAKTAYWHRELPPLDAEPLGEHVVEADSLHVSGSLAHRGELWDRSTST